LKKAKYENFDFLKKEIDQINNVRIVNNTNRNETQSEHQNTSGILYFTLCFVKSFPWLVIEIRGSKIYLYRNIVCQNVSFE